MASLTISVSEGITNWRRRVYANDNGLAARMGFLHHLEYTGDSVRHISALMYCCERLVGCVLYLFLQRGYLYSRSLQIVRLSDKLFICHSKCEIFLCPDNNICPDKCPEYNVPY